MTTLLLVEDDAKITLALGIRLNASGFTVLTAPDAVHAMSQAREHQPDVIVLDVNLPGGDGFTVAQRLKSLHTTTTTPIIFITASKKPGLEDKATALGAVAFLEKPFSGTQLLDAVALAVGNASDFGYQALA